MEGNDSTPGDISQDTTAVGASQSLWGAGSSPQVPGDDTGAVSPSKKGSTAQQPSQSALMETSGGQPMSHDPHGIESTPQMSGHDLVVDDKDSNLNGVHSPGSSEHAQHDSSAHDLNCMVEHLSGHLPDSADEDAPEAEDEERLVEEEDTVWERKQSSMTDIDVVN